MMRKWMCGGLAAVATLGSAWAKPPAVRPNTPSTTQPDPVRKADPLGTMLAEAKGAYGKLRDYSCIFTRQERVNGHVGAEQVAEMKVRVNPACVYLRFARPQATAGLEVSYVSTRASGKLRWRPAGAKGQSGFHSVAPSDPRLKADFHRPVPELGIGPMLELLSTTTAREKVLNNPIEVFTTEYQFAGRNVTRYDIFTRRPHAHRYAYQTVVYVDKENHLPIRIESYDAPAPGLVQGELIEAFSYSDLKLNVGIGASAFDH